MSRLAIWTLAFSATLAACGGDDDIPPGTDAGGMTTDGGGRDAGATDDDAGPAPDDAGPLDDAGRGDDGGSTMDGAIADGGSADAAGADAGPGDAGPPDGGAMDAGSGDGGPPSRLTVSFGTMNLVGAGCMPPVPADPFAVFFEVVADNTAGTTPASGTILDAALLFDDAAATVVDMVVVPTALGPVAPGAMATSIHLKMSSTPILTDPCGLCTNNVTLGADIDVGGRTERIMLGPMRLNCTF